MSSFTRKFVRDNGEELEVDGSFRFESQNNIEVTEYKAWLWADRNTVGSPTVTLTDAEDFRLYEELMADPGTWEYDDDY